MEPWSAFYLRAHMLCYMRVSFLYVSFAIQTGRDRTGQDGTERRGSKMFSNGNKEEEEGDGEVIILCSTGRSSGEAGRNGVGRGVPSHV
ncbi:hypothetical protein DVH24_009679 [Malus domestica]|uniref:Secreted protein n=1 Tax=Malus domestica TaxID=3750 RepID=A0A498JPL1_MALDO|nr:hypothetical protein DVH24_009679 [Malus domestica]